MREITVIVVKDGFTFQFFREDDGPWKLAVWRGELHDVVDRALAPAPSSTHCSLREAVSVSANLLWCHRALVALANGGAS